jgi:hypothetical protein
VIALEGCKDQTLPKSMISKNLHPPITISEITPITPGTKNQKQAKPREVSISQLPQRRKIVTPFILKNKIS